MNSPVRIGIDFGGTKTEIVALDARNGKELYRKRILNEKGSYEVTLQSFKTLVEEAEAQVHDDGNGISSETLADWTALGLRGMRERAAAVGGSVSFRGHPQSGTTVLVRIPLAPRSRG